MDQWGTVTARLTLERTVSSVRKQLEDKGLRVINIFKHHGDVSFKVTGSKEMWVSLDNSDPSQYPLLLDEPSKLLRSNLKIKESE